MKKMFIFVLFTVGLVLFMIGCHAPDFHPPVAEDSSLSDSGDTNVSGVCLPEMTPISGGTYTVGAPAELANEDDKSRVPLGQVTLDDYCVTVLPFPGEGHAWPSEGLNADMVFRLDTVVHNFNLRVATAAEYLVAVSGENNDRYPGGVASWAEANCASDSNPGTIGDYPLCQSRDGVGGLLTYLFWVEVDEETRETLQASQNPPSGSTQYVVLGGLDPKDDAYCGDDLWGYENHGEEIYANERGILLVATPGWVTVDQQTAYDAFVKTFVDSDAGSGGNWDSIIGD